MTQNVCKEAATLGGWQHVSVEIALLFLVRFPKLHDKHAVIASPQPDMNSVVRVCSIGATLHLHDSWHIAQLVVFKPFIFLTVGTFDFWSHVYRKQDQRAILLLKI